ncbi:uncharacterized protein C8Q71DRAFT_860029 [Rhodofomes roseus]|uniref:CASTOR ACT domain-containing protein n=1 Tax=Rhodofomes roseus TaxID=34475 RepID=A0ABQ8K9I5_9APHY|nr:uncharacterized protein C8Q71DRAFT_860029 [Rhodofomes roseus]KAH9833754.1 hypothetical protein C8Q71DRAFT_860029 [Rhodofomes roseus]
MSDSVTISLLPVSLALVHVPRSRLDTLTQHILRQILRPNPSFLNVTCNEIELSLFAEGHALREVEKIARKDARKLRRRREDQDAVQSGQRSQSRRSRPDWEPIEVSSDRWCVLQIDSHSDSLDNSGARVRELSAPLAAAGISILYQSSYMSDFIFVKSSRLSQVMSLLATAGFGLYSDNPTNLTAQLSTFTSPLLSPTQDDTSVSLLDLSALGPTSSTRVDPGGGAVFTRSRSSTDATNSSSGSRAPSILQMSNPHDFSPGPTSPISPLAFDAPPDEDAEADADADTEDDMLMKTPAPGPAPRPAMSRSHSHSPSGCDVSVLVPDLTYVGLSDEHAEMWGLKIVKLVAYPDLIVGTGAGHSASSSESAGPSSPVSPLEATAAAADVSVRIADAVSRIEGGGSGSDTTTRVGAGSDKEDIALYEHTEQCMPWEEDLGDAESSDEDGYFSSSPRLGQSDLLSGARPPLMHHETVDTVHPARPNLAGRSRSDSSSSTSSSSAGPSTSPLVPFFSFTRTSEGSSLTAPVSLLAALFPPNERDMVICSDELFNLDSRQASPERDADEESEDEDGTPQGPLRCLQIDLRKFGLDKHGLVNRFSRTLEENGINHMYNSTYKTANLLVDKAHASRAQALLRSC